MYRLTALAQLNMQILLVNPESAKNFPRRESYRNDHTQPRGNHYFDRCTFLRERTSTAHGKLV